MLFKPECVANLEWLVKNTGAKIVISSTWRFSGLEVMRRMWRKRGMTGEILDITPDCAKLVEDYDFEFYDMVERGHEIQQWLDLNPVDNYVILDDDRDMLKSQQEHFVRTDTSVGLTRDEAQIAAEILLTSNPKSYGSKVRQSL